VTDYGTIKSFNNYETALLTGSISRRGILLRDQNDNVFELATPSNTVMQILGGFTLVRLSDVCAALGASCVLHETKTTEHYTDDFLHFSYDETRYNYCFDITYDKDAARNLAPALPSYPEETFETYGIYVDDVSVDFNGTPGAFVYWHFGHMGFPSGERGSGFYVIDGEVYIPAYTVAKMLGYAFGS
jgi:hypothetical protein